MLPLRALALLYRSPFVRRLRRVLPHRNFTLPSLPLCAALLFPILTAFAQTGSVTVNSTTCSPAGGEITFTVNLSYAANVSYVAFETKPKSGEWSYRGTAGVDAPNLRPGVGETTDPYTASSKFSWLSSVEDGLPASALSFTFVLRYPAGLTGNQEFAFSGFSRADGVNTPLVFSGPSPVLTVVSVGPPPVLSAISAPRQIVSIGHNLQLAVSATGATGYQWKRNGRPIVGATDASYAIVAALPSRDSGWYQVGVANGGGVTSSAVVFVNVVMPSADYVGIGENFYGQRAVPIGLGDVAALAGGGTHTVAVKSAGTVAAWGQGDGGRTAVPAGLDTVVAVAAGYSFSLALRSNGTVVGWGENYRGQTTIPSGLTGVVAIACGYGHGLALKSDGTVVGWGMNDYGQATIPAGLSGVVAIAAGDSHSLALKADGGVVAWGLNADGQATVPGWLSGVVALAAGGFHSLAWGLEGGVAAWGSNFSGQTTLPPGLSDVRTVVAGTTHSLALRSDGTALAWGYPGAGVAAISGGLPRVGHLTAGGYFGLFLLYPPGDVLPVITTKPEPIIAFPGDDATFSVVANGGTAPTVFQWRKNWIAIPGATGASYTLRSVTADDAGYFDVVVTNYVGAVTSAFVALNVNYVPVITGSPLNQTVAPGQTAVFGVDATGTRPRTYRWQRQAAGTTDFTDLAASAVYVGVTTSTLYVTGTTVGMHGDRFRCIVNNAFDSSATSAAALLLVTAPPAFTSPATTAFFINRPVSFKVTTSGAPAPTFTATGLPPWATLNTTTGVISGTAPDAVGAPFTITLTATNGIGSPVTQTFLLSVRLAHSADVAPVDGAIDLAELTRVIALYNTRNGTVRTSRYKIHDGTEDGFDPDAVTPGATTVTLAHYHSADSNRDGRMSLVELTRVIELFNNRTANTRTGAYHVQPGTEDGFAPGP